MVNLDPVVGHEQAGMRPCLVVSVDVVNQSQADLAIVTPITSKSKQVRFHVPIAPPEAGLSRPSFIKCEDVRSISLQRFGRHLGAATSATLRLVEERLRALMGL
jgi:mRNA interferase MazF